MTLLIIINKLLKKINDNQAYMFAGSLLAIISSAGTIKSVFIEKKSTEHVESIKNYPKRSEELEILSCIELDKIKNRNHITVRNGYSICEKSNILIYLKLSANPNNYTYEVISKNVVSKENNCFKYNNSNFCLGKGQIVRLMGDAIEYRIPIMFSQ